jgi:hypothetical protein
VDEPPITFFLKNSQYFVAKKKKKKFDVFVFANGPNFGRGGVEVYNNSLYGFKSQRNCYVSFFFIFQSTYLGAS